MKGIEYRPDATSAARRVQPPAAAPDPAKPTNPADHPKSAMNDDFPPTPTVRSGTQDVPGWRIAWAQVTGVRHAQCEDRIAIRPLRARAQGDAVFLAVADGVGGGARGDIAAQALAEHAVDLPAAALGDAGQIADWMRRAEDRVRSALHAVTFAPGAATLAAAWLRSDGNGHLLRIGDARAYYLDDQHAVALTEDQTYEQRGEAPDEGASADDCACMVGTGHMGEPEVQPLALPLAASLLLCSDGLHRGLTAGELHAALAPASGEVAPLAAVAARLATAARAAGSNDDISLVIAQRRPAPPVRRWWQRLFWRA